MQPYIPTRRHLSRESIRQRLPQRLRRHRLPAAGLFLLIVLCVLYARSGPGVPAAAAAVIPGGNVGIGVPGLRAPAPDVLATTRQLDTMLAPDSATPQRAALTLLTRTGVMPTSGATFANLGSVYGLAYDDGSVSGTPRLLIGAYAKRMVAFGPGGPGAIYQYPLPNGPATVFATIAGTTNRHGGQTDTGMIPWVGKSSLGDLEVAPDGATLYALNLDRRSIARLPLAAGGASGEIPLDLGQITTDPTIQADLWPCALAFRPTIAPDTTLRLYVGLVDSAERDRGASGVFPKIHVLEINLTTGVQTRVLAQALTNTSWPQPNVRLNSDSTWNAWTNQPHDGDRNQGAVQHPRPMLTSIAFARDGQRMLLGLRDRTGDQLTPNGAASGPPPGERRVIAQGDTMVYAASGTGWRLVTTADFYHDNALYSTLHNENHAGALATVLTGVGGGAPLAFAEDLVTTSLFGEARYGVRWYDLATGGSARTNTQLSATDPNDPVDTGKANSIGDLVTLASAAVIGETVWLDQNGNGQQDTGEPGIDGVRIDLRDGRNQVLASATSANGGLFRFVIPPNRSDLSLVLPADNFDPGQPLAGLIMAPQHRGDAARDSDADEIAKAIFLPRQWRDYTNMTFAFGVMPPQGNGVIGDFVWRDTNGNGMQDNNEPGINGISVYLEHCRNDKADCGDGADRHATSTTRQLGGRDGAYLFDRLLPGYYRVQFAPPAGSTATLRDAGPDDRDSDVDSATGWRTRELCVVNGNHPNPQCHHTHLTWDLGLRADLHVRLRLADIALHEIPSGADVDRLKQYPIVFASSSGRTMTQRTDSNQMITLAWADGAGPGEHLTVRPGVPSGMFLYAIDHDCAVGAPGSSDLNSGQLRAIPEGCAILFTYVLAPIIEAETVAQRSNGTTTALPDVAVTLHTTNRTGVTRATDAAGEVVFDLPADDLRPIVPRNAWELSAPPTVGALRRVSSAPLTISPIHTSRGYRFTYHAPITVRLLTTDMTGTERGRLGATRINFTNAGQVSHRTTAANGETQIAWIDTGPAHGTLGIAPDLPSDMFLSLVTHDCGPTATPNLTAGTLTIPASSLAATGQVGCTVTFAAIPRPVIAVSVVGERTSGTAPLAGVPVRLLTATMHDIATVTSAADGTVRFTLSDATLRSLVGPQSAFWQVRPPPSFGSLDLRAATPAARRQGSPPALWLKLDPVGSSSDNRFVYGADIEVRIVEHGMDGQFIRARTAFPIAFVDRTTGATTNRTTASDGAVTLRWLDVAEANHPLSVQPARPDVSDPKSVFLWKIEETAGCGTGTSQHLDEVWYRPTAGDGCQVTFVFIAKPTIQAQTVGRYADGTPITGPCPSGYAAPAGTCPIPFLTVALTQDGRPTEVVRSDRSDRAGRVTFAFTSEAQVQALRALVPVGSLALYAQQTITVPWDTSNAVGDLVEAVPGEHATAHPNPWHVRISPVVASAGNVFIYAVNPPTPPTATHDVRLWIHSRFDQAQGPRVYRTQSQQFTWPTGEILDFTPAVTVTLHGQSPFPDHFRFSARTVSWSYVQSLVHGQARRGTGSDDLNRTGCRERDEPFTAADAAGLDGCAYRYVTREQPLPADLSYQGHVFYAANQLMPIEPDVYAYQLGRLEAPHLRVQVKSFITVAYVHTRPDGMQEIESLTRPQIDQGDFRVALVVPRMVQ